MKKGLHPGSSECLQTKALAGAARPSPLLSDREPLAQRRQRLEGDRWGGDPEPRKRDCESAAGKQVFQGLCLTSYLLSSAFRSSETSLIL